ncbi:salicylate hydroxylase [Bisporella sp. PMI_857]|nr:salicylate hydroxylase [Bisporella sp. PMI_857]
MPSASPAPIRVGIIGGGPGGLGTAIALSALPNVSVTIYEQATVLREIGAGIQIGLNCWKVLDLFDAADRVKGHRVTKNLHRNGLTGELLLSQGASSDPPRVQSHRVRRTRLQSELKARVPEGIIKLKKRLAKIENLDDGTARLFFEDGTEAVVDLVVGGDGIRSVVRDHTFKGHEIQFTGTTIWRTLIPLATVSPEINDHTSWWHGKAGHVYFSPVDDPSETSDDKQMFEIACRNIINPATALGKRYSWGVPATKERVEAHFTDFDPLVRETLASVPEGNWKEFAAFAGPRLHTLHAWGKVVLIGDASHPLSGAFGSGAAFALEDGYILARAIEYTRLNSAQIIPDALKIFDAIRSPYYARMYEYLDEQKSNAIQAKAANPDQTFEEGLKIRLDMFKGGENMKWIYRNNIEEVWESYLNELDKGKK